MLKCRRVAQRWSCKASRKRKKIRRVDLHISKKGCWGLICAMRLFGYLFLSAWQDIGNRLVGNVNMHNGRIGQIATTVSFINPKPENHIEHGIHTPVEPSSNYCSYRLYIYIYICAIIFVLCCMFFLCQILVQFNPKLRSITYWYLMILIPWLFTYQCAWQAQQNSMTVHCGTLQPKKVGCCTEYMWAVFVFKNEGRCKPPKTRLPSASCNQKSQIYSSVS